MAKFLLKIPTGVLSCFVILALIYLSLSPNPLGSRGILLFPYADKVAHFLMYLGLAAVFLLDYAKLKMPHHSGVNINLALTSVAVMFGLVMEICQLVWPELGRTFDWIDWCADAAGGVVAFFLMHFMLLHRLRKTYHRERYHHHRHHHRHHRSNSSSGGAHGRCGTESDARE